MFSDKKSNIKCLFDNLSVVAKTAIEVKVQAGRTKKG